MKKIVSILAVSGILFTEPTQAMDPFQQDGQWVDEGAARIFKPTPKKQSLPPKTYSGETQEDPSSSESAFLWEQVFQTECYSLPPKLTVDAPQPKPKVKASRSKHKVKASRSKPKVKSSRSKLMVEGSQALRTLYTISEESHAGTSQGREGDASSADVYDSLADIYASLAGDYDDTPLVFYTRVSAPIDYFERMRKLMASVDEFGKEGVKAASLEGDAILRKKESLKRSFDSFKKNRAELKGLIQEGLKENFFTKDGLKVIKDWDQQARDYTKGYKAYGSKFKQALQKDLDDSPRYSIQNPEMIGDFSKRVHEHLLSIGINPDEAEIYYSYPNPRPRRSPSARHFKLTWNEDTVIVEY